LNFKEQPDRSIGTRTYARKAGQNQITTGKNLDKRRYIPEQTSAQWKKDRVSVFVMKLFTDISGSESPKVEGLFGVNFSIEVSVN